MRHYLKIKQCYLERIMDGVKKFEVRFNDRDYQVNDTIRFTVLPDYGPGYIPDYIITYVHHGLGMQDNYVVLGIRPIEIDEKLRTNP